MSNEESKQYLGYIAVVGVLGLTAISILTVGVEITSILVNAVLTTALVVLYRSTSKGQQKQVTETSRQADLQREVVETQSRQTDLIEKQQELTILEQRPILQVEGYRPADPELSRYSTSALELKASNIGQTPAMDLQIEFTTGFPDDLPLSSGRSLVSVRRKEEDENWHHEWGENLEASEQDIVYVAEPLMLVWRNVRLEKTKKRALEFMKKEDKEFENVDEIRLRANLVYEGMGQKYTEPVFDYIVSLESYGGMIAALEHGRPYNDPMNMKISDEIVEFDGY